MADVLSPVSALAMLVSARNELYAGLQFIRSGVPCDSIDKEHLHAAHELLAILLASQKGGSQ
jgi:hypothetical protein